MEKSPINRIFIADEGGNIEEKDKIEHDSKVEKENNPVIKKLKKITGKEELTIRKISDVVDPLGERRKKLEQQENK